MRPSCATHGTRLCSVCAIVVRETLDNRHIDVYAAGLSYVKEENVAATRINLSVDDERLKKINDLMKRTGAKSKGELFTYALTLYDWVTREVEEGKELVSYEKDSRRMKELEMPSFRTAREQARRRSEEADA